MEDEQTEQTPQPAAPLVPDGDGATDSQQPDDSAMPTGEVREEETYPGQDEAVADARDAVESARQQAAQDTEEK